MNVSVNVSKSEQKRYFKTMIYYQGLYKYNYTLGKRDISDCIFVSSS